MISYQLYSSRNFPPLDATLAMLAKAGYDGAEGYGGLYGDKPALDALAAALRANGLAMKTGHFGLDMVERQPDFVIEIARTVGMEKVFVPAVAPDQRPKDGAGWRGLGARLAAAGAPLRAAGLGFGWHNHAFEFEPCADGTMPMTAIFEGGPALEWEIDVAWLLRGGQDPLAWIKTHAARITAAHIKDIAAAGEKADEDGWEDVGHGTVNWPPIIAALRATGCQQFVMEHDNPNDHQRFATRSLAAVKAF